MILNLTWRVPQVKLYLATNSLFFYNQISHLSCNIRFGHVCGSLHKHGFHSIVSFKNKSAVFCKCFVLDKLRASTRSFYLIIRAGSSLLSSLAVTSTVVKVAGMIEILPE